MIFDFFKFKHKCRHEKVSADVAEAYCPDCGALIQNKWFIVRCKCCNIKRSAHIHYDDIIPNSKYCQNCGSSEFYIQELETLNFTDIHYAVFKKTIADNLSQNISTNQIWVDEESQENNKYIEMK